MKNPILLLLFLSIHVLVSGQIKEASAIDSIFSEWNKPGVPGGSLGIIKNGELIYSNGYGFANLEYNIPNSESSVFRIGSTSKQFTAACIILLAQEKKLRLDDKLKDYFQDFPAYAEEITVKHLLNHTSGIRDYLQLAYSKGSSDDDYYTDAQIMQWLINQSELNFSPGEEYLYSNSGYWLLGQIVNKVSGMDMAEFAKKRLFEPLEMHNTHFHNDHTQIVKNRASGYIPNNKGEFKISMTTLDMIGDGGIFTSINDIKNWDDAYYNSEVLNRSFWEKMTEQGLLNSGDTLNYASGLIVSKYRGLKTIRHGGSFVGFRAELLRFPDEKLSIAIFANRGDANPSKKANQVADILLKNRFTEDFYRKDNTAILEEPEVVFKLSALEGKYEIDPGIILQISVENDSLKVFNLWNNSSYTIKKVKGNIFQIPDEENFKFLFSNLKDRSAQTLTIIQNGKDIIAKRIRDIDTSNLKLDEYSGSYYSKELDLNYIFKMEDQTLKLYIDDKPSPLDCTLIEKDQIVMQLGVAKFQRNDGKISSFNLDSGRVKNINFRKK